MKADPGDKGLQGLKGQKGMQVGNAGVRLISCMVLVPLIHGRKDNILYHS